MTDDELIEALVDAICQLARVNQLTGIWDHRRFHACKKPVEQVDVRYLYKTEKLSRANVELRAVYRAQIDRLFERLIVRGRSSW